LKKRLIGKAGARRPVVGVRLPPRARRARGVEADLCGSRMKTTSVHDPPLSPEQSARVAELGDQELRNIDEALLAEVSAQWRKVARVVGGAMSHQSTRIPGIPDLFYAQRVRHLVDSGLLESSGDLGYMGRSEVRLSSGRKGG